MSKSIKIGLLGQPNTGKSTMFNALTKGDQHVGNWPGKTVEQKWGTFQYNNKDYTLVDLPGTYSLSANSSEEKISQDFILDKNPDLLIVMADASQLERSLYLLSEASLLQVPIIVALNMIDVAQKQGKEFNINKLTEKLGHPVVAIVASKGEGLNSLLEKIDNYKNQKREANKTPNFESDKYYSILNKELSKKANKINAPWFALKMAEGDKAVETKLKEKIKTSDFDSLKFHIKENENHQISIANIKYNWINEALFESTTIKKQVTKKLMSRFDNLATHSIGGKLLAIFVLILSFSLGMIFAMPFMLLFQKLSLNLASLINANIGVKWVASLLSDGLIPGVALALMMLAFIFIIYMIFGFLEDIGYMSRLAYVFDRPMNRIGLHGKSCMPLLMSFGCNIAGVTGTRVIDSWQQRIVTMVLVSIIPCIALWGVVGFIGTIFFGSIMPLIILALLITMIIHLSLTSLMLRKWIVPQKTMGLIMELPPYHKPNWKTIFSYTKIQTEAFLKRALTLIAFLSVIIWALSYRPDGNINESMLASIGRFFNPISNFLGLDWRLLIALLAGTIAKEASLSVIAVLYGLGGTTYSISSYILNQGTYQADQLTNILALSISPASALAFIFAFFFSIPCIGTVATLYTESKSLKWTFGSAFYYIFSSLIIGGIAYRLGLLIF